MCICTPDTSVHLLQLLFVSFVSVGSWEVEVKFSLGPRRKIQIAETTLCALVARLYQIQGSFGAAHYNSSPAPHPQHMGFKPGAFL